MEEAKWMYSDEDNFEEKAGIKNGDGGSSSGIVNNDLDIPNVDKTKKDSSEPADNTNPSDNTDPADNTDPSDNTDPADSTDPADDTDPTDDKRENINKPSGDLVLIYKDSDINTGITIEDSMYWPQKDIAKADIDNGIKSDHDTIPLKAGDVFTYNDSVYYVVQDRNLDYYTLAHNGADVICDMGWELVYRIDYEHVLTKEDFPPYPNWGEDARVIFVNNMAGKLYYSEEENIVYMAKSNQNNYFLPTKNNYKNFIIFKDFNEE